MEDSATTAILQPCSDHEMSYICIQPVCPEKMRSPQGRAVFNKITHFRNSFQCITKSVLKLSHPLENVFSRRVCARAKYSVIDIGT